jgi:hypothetical protein
MKFEEEYQDVLQNIEFAIVSVYRQQPALLDYDVETALNSLARAYRHGEAPPPPEGFNDLQQAVYTRVKAICDLRMGKESLADQEGEAVELLMQAVTPAEIVACLKRIQKSVQKWTKQGGRQGYLTFVDNFIV